MRDLRRMLGLDRRSDGLAASVLDPLSEEPRSRLTAAMAEVERLLVASMVRVAVEDPASPEAGWCMDRRAPPATVGCGR